MAIRGHKQIIVAFLAMLTIAASASIGMLFIYGHGSSSFLICRLAFDHYLTSDSKELDEEARSGLSSTYYFTSYYLNGILSAAEGTGSERTLRRALAVIDTMLTTSERFEYRGRDYPAWKPFTITADTSIPRPNLHFSFQATVPIARAAAIINRNPDWRVKYRVSADRYIQFADHSIIQYWYHEVMGGEIPWLDTDRFPLWNDNASNLGLVAVFLYEATGNQSYRSIAGTVAKSLKAKLVPHKNGWIWDDGTIPIGSDTDNTPGSVGNQEGVPDTSHANREAFLMTSLYEAGIVFTRSDLDQMAHTVTETLWNQSFYSPAYSNYLDGGNAPYRVYKGPGLNGSVYHGWVLLGGYSLVVQTLMFDTLQAILKGRTNPSLERNARSYGGMLGLSGHLLRNFHLLGTVRRSPSPAPGLPGRGAQLEAGLESSFY